MNLKRFGCMLALSSLVLSPVSVFAEENTNSEDENDTVEMETIQGEGYIEHHDTLDDVVLKPGSTESPLPDPSQVPEDGMGTVSLTLTDSEDGRSKEGVMFGMAKVADIENGIYTLTNGFEESEVDMQNIKNSDQLKEAAWALSEYTSPKDVILQTDENGQIVTDKLEVGVYLFYIYDVNDYEYIDPFLVAIPTWDDTLEGMNYNVEVLPKHSPLPKIRVNKVDEETDKTITDEDFKFTAFADKGCTERIEEKSNEDDGTITFQVNYGDTYIRETEAPDGYFLSDEVIKVTVNYDGMFINDKKVEPNEELIYTYDYDNEKIPEIETGTASNMMILGISMIALAGVATVTIRLRNR